MSDQSHIVSSISSFGAMVQQVRMMEHSLNRLEDGMLVLDEELRVLFANTTASQILGITYRKLKDRILTNTCPELVNSVFLKTCQACFESKEEKSNEILIGAGNQAFHMDVYPGPAGIEVFLRKNFQIKTQLETGAIGTSPIVSAFEYLHDGVIAADPTNRCFAYVNRSICRMLGYSKDELLSLFINDIHPPTEMTRVERDFARMAAGNFEPSHDIIVKRKNGSLFPCDIHVFYLEYEGRPLVWAVFRDTTERMQAREELVAVKKQAEQKNELAGRTRKIARLGYWEFEHAENNLHWSDEIFDLLGLESGSTGISRDQLLRHIHPDDLADVQQAYVAHLRLKTDYSVVFRVIKKGGAVMYLHERATTVYDSQGNAQRTLGVLMDIGLIKETEEKLREHEKRLSQLARESRNFAWEVDLNGLYTYISPVVTDVLGYKPEEVTGKLHFYDLHPEEGRQAFKDAAFEVFRQKQKFIGLENKVVHKDGTVMWVLTNGIPLLDFEGRLTGYRGSDTDITSRLKMEEALRKSEENFRQIADNVEEVFWLRNADNSQLIYVNHAYQKVFGQSCESLYVNPASFLDAIHPDDKAAVLTGYANYFTNYTFNETFRIIRPDGSIRWVQSNSRPIYGPNNKITGHTGMAVDITDRKQYEEDLKQYAQELANSNSMLNSLLNSLPDLIWLKDENGRYIRSNRRFSSFTGFSMEEMNGKTDFDLFPKEIAEFFREHDAIAREQNGPVMNEESVTFADGHTELLETVKTPMYDSAGRFMGVLGIGHDITHRKRSEDTLRMERDLFSEGPVFTITWSSEPDWPVINVSENVETILGYSPEEMKDAGFRYATLIHPDDIARIAEEVKHHVQNRMDSFEQSYRLRLKNGEYRWFYDFTRFIRDEKNKIVVIRGYLIDQTAQREMESALEERNKQLNVIVQNIPGAVFSFTGPEKRNFNFLTKFICDITGYEPEELQAKKSKLFTELVHPDDLSQLRRIIRKAHIHKENYSFTYRIRHKDKSWRWVYETGEFQSFEGAFENLKVDGILFDMTDKITAEEDKLNAVYQAADAERTRIAREIHDGLQQTMVAGKLNMEMLKNELDKVDPVLQQRYLTGLQFLEQAVHEARSISHSLMPKQVHDFGFVPAVENMLSNLDRKIEFKFYHNDVVVKNDNVSLNLYRIIQEAISNILKHAKATRVDINLTAVDNRLNLTIEDNGTGFRMPDKRGMKDGLGLQSMKSRAATIGGSFEIYSEPGQGTLIVIELEQ